MSCVQQAHRRSAPFFLGFSRNFTPRASASTAPAHLQHTASTQKSTHRGTPHAQRKQHSEAHRNHTESNLNGGVHPFTCNNSLPNDTAFVAF